MFMLLTWNMFLEKFHYGYLFSALVKKTLHILESSFPVNWLGLYSWPSSNHWLRTPIFLQQPNCIPFRTVFQTGQVNYNDSFTKLLEKSSCLSFPANQPMYVIFTNSYFINHRRLPRFHSGWPLWSDSDHRIIYLPPCWTCFNKTKLPTFRRGEI